MEGSAAPRFSFVCVVDAGVPGAGAPTGSATLAEFVDEVAQAETSSEAATEMKTQSRFMVNRSLALQSRMLFSNRERRGIQTGRIYAS